MKIIFDNKLYKLYNLTKEQQLYILTKFTEKDFLLKVYILNNQIQLDISNIDEDFDDYHLSIDDMYITSLGDELLAELLKIRLNSTNKIIACEEELIAQLLGYKSIWSDEMTENEQLFRDILLNTLKIYYAGHRCDDYFDQNMKDKLIEIRNQLFKLTP